MDYATLLQLKKNPHYKLSDKQKAELAEYERKPMVEFGTPPIHNQEVRTHQTKVVRKAR